MWRDYNLLKELENAYRFEDDPIRKGKLSREIKVLGIQIEKHQEELASLKAKLQNNPVSIVDEENDNPFTNDKMPGSAVDLPASANEEHGELFSSSEGKTKTSGEVSTPKVFISYSHDSPEHADRVLDLSNHLCADGIDCILDQYEDSPPEGFPRWMDRQIHDADFVLMICTRTYFRRVMGTEKPDAGRGVAWESTLIYQYIYNAGSSNRRFIPVLLEGAYSSDIPTPWQGVRYYRPDTSEGYESLYRRLTDQPFTVKPALGKLRKMPPRERKQGFDELVAIEPQSVASQIPQTKEKPTRQPQQKNFPDIPMRRDPIEEMQTHRQKLEAVRKKLHPGNLRNVLNTDVETYNRDIHSIYNFMEEMEEKVDVLKYISSPEVLKEILGEIMLELQTSLASWDISKVGSPSERLEAISDYLKHLNKCYVLLRDALDHFRPSK